MLQLAAVLVVYEPADGGSVASAVTRKLPGLNPSGLAF